MRIGILEDNPEHAIQITRALAEGNHGCNVFPTGARFLQGLVRDSFDLLILDWMLPDLTGLEVLRRLRERGLALPVLFVTSREDEEDIVAALVAGADDYLVKPIRPRELLARLDALARRAGNLPDEKRIVAPPYRFELDAGEAWLGDERIVLNERQFALAAFLFRHPGRLLSRVHLMEAVWGVGTQVQSRTLDVHVSQLRGALRLTSENGWRLASIYGHGYRLEPAN
jgi:DNA-binding response OmpR family regulator